MERFEEDVMDLEKKLKKVQDQFDAAKQVAIKNFTCTMGILMLQDGSQTFELAALNK